jgi:prepilin-type N-terminal cleavage/methylation domain-containing protein
VFKRKKQRPSKKFGFSIIELLVVISIIALLSSALLSNVNNVRKKARDTKRITDLKAIKTAFEWYQTTDPDGNYPNSGGSFFSTNGGGLNNSFAPLTTIVGPILPSFPNDPLNITGQFGYYYAVGYKSCGSGGPPFCPTGNFYSYVLSTRLETPNHPQINSGPFIFQDNNNLNYYLTNQ